MNKTINILFVLLAAIFSFTIFQTMNPIEVDASAFGNMKIDSSGNLSGIEKKKTSEGFNDIFEKYRSIIAGVSGIVAISMMLFFIIQAFRLGSSAHNASERQKAIQGMIWIGIATAISGSVSLFAGLFYGMLN